MLIYILKSAACLAILFLFYKAFLEKENMHVFKRFYLLGGLLFSLLVPALVFTEYVEVPPTTEINYPVVQHVADSNGVINVPPALEADVLDIAPMLWGIYFIGLFIFGIKFLRNLSQIFWRIRRNPKQRLARFTQVLLHEKISPHTFFSYVFLNKMKFESNEIPEEVLLHEETHAKQKHSLDVVFVELLQVVLWFNPFVYLIKKSIKLNHEFLADQAVLKKDIDKTTYQNTLLSYLSPDSQKKYQPQLANAINYSSIKKRFTVMKKRTSKKSILLRSFLLLPLLAVLLYSFSETKTTFTSKSKNNPSFNQLLPETNNFDNLLNIKESPRRIVELAGLILNSETLKPVKNVQISDSKGNIISTTDDLGYYKAKFDRVSQDGELLFEYSLSKNGYQSLLQKEHWGNLQGKIESVVYFGLQKEDSSAPEFSEPVTRTKNLTYNSIIERFPFVKERFEFRRRIENSKKK